jgi:hypothetical protein
MSPTPNRVTAPPPPLKPEEIDFAEEAGPKESEFGRERDAKNLTAGEFDPIP